jgi:hypothetical protein
MHSCRQTWEFADILAGMKYKLLPIVHGEKHPSIKGWQQLVTSREAVSEWFAASGYRMNYGVRGGETDDGPVAIIDWDDKEQGLEWIAKHRIDTFIVATARGLHVYCAGTVENRNHPDGEPVDVIGPGKFVVGPGSFNRERQTIYRALTAPRPPHALAPVPEAIRRREAADRDRAQRVGVSPLVSKNRLTVRAWIAKVFSVSGQRGHNNCYRAACKLVDAGLNRDEAWEELCLWNSTNASPPWSERELNHKLTDAFKRKR